MKCKEFDNQIERYFNDELPQEQRESFEEHYFSCDQCFIKVQISEKLRNKAVRIVTSDKKPLMIFKPVMVFSSLFLVVFASILIFNQIHINNALGEITPFEPPQYFKTTIRNSNTDNRFDEAMDFYNKKEFQKSLDLLNNFEKKDPTPRVIFFKGICSLFINKYREAINHFDSIIDSMDPSYYDDAVYYKGITLLKLKKKKAAIRQFENLSQMFSPRAAEAKSLLKKLASI